MSALNILIGGESFREIRERDCFYVDKTDLLEELLASDAKLAFDHKKIIEYGRERIKNKTEYTQIAFEFLEEEFTLPQLQKVYEILLGKSLHKANFRRKVMPMVEETERMTMGDAHRPSKIYRVKEKKNYEV